MPDLPVDKGLFPQGIVREESDKFLESIKSQIPDAFCPNCGSAYLDSQYRCVGCGLQSER